MSGAADVIAQLKDDADDSDIPLYLASTDFANILTAKLLGAVPLLVYMALFVFVQTCLCDQHPWSML
jgi:hypothetical protein